MLKVSQSEEQKYYAYYFVTLLSSIGSMAYVGCLVAYMLGGGYSFAQIGFTIGITRFMPLLTTLVFGDLADRKNPFNIISTTDFIAVLMSVLMIFAWYAGKDYFHLFLILPFLDHALFQFSMVRVGNSPNFLVKIQKKRTLGMLSFLILLPRVLI